MNLRLRIYSVLIISLILLTACGKEQIVLTTGFGADEVFRVDDEHCSTGEVLLYMRDMGLQYEKAYGSGIFESGTDDLRDELKQTALARVGRVKLMSLMARVYHVSLNKEEEKLANEAAEAYYSALLPEEIAAMDKLSRSEVLKLMNEYAVAQKLYKELTKDVDTEVSDDAARIISLHQIALYVLRVGDDGTEYSSTIEELRQRAAELKQRINEGEDFDALAYANNEAPELSISFPKGVMPKAVEDVCFALSEGEVSEVVATEEGVFIFKCISTYDREQTEARKSELAVERQKQAFEAKYEDYVRDKAYYLNEELWEQVEYSAPEQKSDVDFFSVYEEYFP